MVENLPFNSRQYSSCKYGGVVVVPSGDHPNKSRGPAAALPVRP